MAVEKFPDEISAIRTILSEHPDGLTIRSISAMLGMNRNSTAKYLDMLQMQGGVTLKRSGSSKIYYLADKLPVAAVLKLTKSHVIIFDQGLAAGDINDSCTDLLTISKKEIIGKTPDLLPFAVQCHPGLSRLIKEGLRKESKTSGVITIGDRVIPCKLTSSPVFFENGNYGVALIIDPDQTPQAGVIFPSYEDDFCASLDVTEYLCRFGPDGTFTYVNTAYCDLLHKTKAELIGHPWRPTIPESEGRKIKTCLRSLNPAHPVASVDIRAITRAGDTQWQRWKFRHLFDRQGQSAGYQGTGQDITELKNLELKNSKIADAMQDLIQEGKTEIQELNKQIYDEIASHERTHFQLQFTQFAMDAASYMITWISSEGRFIYMNRQAQKVLGYQYRDVISKKFQDILAGIFPFPWDEIWEIIKRDRQYTLETVLRTNKGDEIPVEIVLNYLEFKDKQYCCCFANDITERKQAEEALRVSEKKFRNIFEKSVSGLFKTAPDGRLIDANDAFGRMYGYSGAAEILTAGLDVGRDLYVNPEDRKKVLQILAENGKVENYEARHIKRDGTRLWVAITARTIRDAEGAVRFYEGSYHDITERKRAEEELRESRQILEAVLNSIPARVFWKDKNSVYLGCNTTFARDAGFNNPEDIIGKDDYAMGWADLAERYRTDDRAVIGSGIAKLLFEEPQTTPTGGRIQLLTSKVPLRDADGAIIGVLGTYLDITERKMAESALKDSEYKYRMLVENIPEKIFVKDASLAYVSCNDLYARDLGIPGEAIAGKTDFDFYPRDLAEKYRADDRAVMESGTATRIEDLYIIQGKESWVSTLKTPIRDDAGNVSGILGIFHDITKRRKMEDDYRKKTFQQLQTSYENLQETETELRLHQTELEVQNEELRQTQHNLEQSREQYYNLYDLAPVGYFTIDKNGLIITANLTAATFLGIERHSLEKKPFTRYIVPDDQDIFYLCRRELLRTRDRQSCELRMLHAGGSFMNVQVIAVAAPVIVGDETAICLMVIDIPYGKRAYPSGPECNINR